MIATVCALWYAFYRDRKQDKKINDLANIVGQLNNANNLQKIQNDIQQKQHDIELREKTIHARPKMEIQNNSIDTASVLKISIANTGQRAIVGGVTFPENNEINFHFNVDVIDQFNSFTFYGKSKSSKDINDCDYAIYLTFSDIYKNPYWLRIHGEGSVMESFSVVDSDHMQHHPG